VREGLNLSQALFGRLLNVRDTLRAVAALAALSCLAAPFADGPNHWMFALAGLGYSAFLCFMSAGVCLLPQQIRARVVRTTICVQSACLLLVLAFVGFLLHFQRVPTLPMMLVTSVIGVLLAVLTAFAGRGWHLHFSRRLKPSAGPAA
jgi:peptidoglycan/LPS O-acetylase OafA/YrhL